MSHENARIWFVFHDKKVLGPFLRDEVLLKVKENAYKATDLVWQRGAQRWQKLEDWETQKNGIEKPLTSNPSREVMFYVQAGGLNAGPIPASKVLEQIRKKKLPPSTLLWTEGLNQWLPVYESPLMVAEMGLNKRRYPRAPFVGTVKLDFLDGDKSVETLGISVSEGGMGIRLVSDLELGQEISLTVNSELLSSKFFARAVPVYKTADEIGLQFAQLSTEGRAAVVEYVIQFEGAHRNNALKKLA
jgi:hypothetical protein